MRTVRLKAKCDDRFSMTFEDNKRTIEFKGDPPDFLNGDSGDGYVDLLIDVDTGRIINWALPTQEDMDIMALHGTTTNK